jgi:hypothetical protein
LPATVALGGVYEADARSGLMASVSDVPACASDDAREREPLAFASPAVGVGHTRTACPSGGDRGRDPPLSKASLLALNDSAVSVSFGLLAVGVGQCREDAGAADVETMPP